MMQIASKEKDRGKKKAGLQSKSKNQRPAAAKLHAARERVANVTWDEVERQQPFAGREAVMVKRAIPVAMAQAPVAVNVVNQPIDCSQLTTIQTQGTQETQEAELGDYPSFPAQLTDSELVECRHQKQAETEEEEAKDDEVLLEEEEEAEDIFANAETHEMNARVGLPPNDDDTSTEDKGPCQLKHKENNCKKLLTTMLYGLCDADTGRQLWDLSLEAYKSVRQKSLYAPVADEIKEEVTRRAEYNGMDPMPKPKWWSKLKAEEWLIANPIQALRDINFLIETEATVRAELEEEKKERETIQELKRSNRNWNDIYPFLRLPCCMCDDRARDALLSKDNGWAQQELDARNHEDRPKTWFEVVADLHNDPENIYFTEVLPELSSRFVEPIELQFQDMPGGEITPEQVRGRYADSRCQLIPIVNDWEQSGNGFGQRNVKDTSWGHCSEEHQEGDNHTSFLHKANKEYLVYFRYLADTEGILKNMLNVLVKDVRIDCDGKMRVDTSQVQHKRKKSVKEEDKQKDRKTFRIGLNQSMSTVAITALRENLDPHNPKLPSTKSRPLQKQILK